MTSKTIKTLIIEPDGSSRIETIEPDLPTMQHIVGGYIEAVTVGTWTAYCDEEGKIKGLTANLAATLLAHTLGWTRGDVLCGPVLFLGNGANGSESDVPDVVLSTWRQSQLTA